MTTNHAPLFIKYAPIIYFHRKEPYMPANFVDILAASDVTIDEKYNINNIPSLSETDLISIDETKAKKHPIASQILCKTNGVFTYNGDSYIDLVYIVTFTWNGTREAHAFDKEEVIVRVHTLDTGDELVRVFGSAHGNGMWFDPKYVEMDGTHPIMYSGLESHAMYNDARTHKRIFGFGNDITEKAYRWEPTRFIIFSLSNDTTPAYSVAEYDVNDASKPVAETVGYMMYKGMIGNAKNNQIWPGAQRYVYDTLNMDAFYKYQGGLDNLFTGPHAKVKPSLRNTVRIVAIVAWSVFILYLIYRDALDHMAGHTGVYTMILYMFLHVLVTLGLLVTGSYIGLELFVFSPK